LTLSSVSKALEASPYGRVVSAPKAEKALAGEGSAKALDAAAAGSEKAPENCGLRGAAVVGCEKAPLDADGVGRGKALEGSPNGEGSGALESPKESD